MKTTQNVTSETAISALDQLAQQLGCPPSRVLERILDAVPVDDLVALATGRLTTREARVIALDASTLFAITDAVSAAVGSLADRVELAARLGAKDGAK